jgi:hypothetical protein
MWEPRRLTTLWAFTTCYGDRFTFTFIYNFSAEIPDFLTFFIFLRPSRQFQDRTSVRSWPLPSKSFPIHEIRICFLEWTICPRFLTTGNFLFSSNQTSLEPSEKRLDHKKCSQQEYALFLGSDSRKASMRGDGKVKGSRLTPPCCPVSFPGTLSFSCKWDRPRQPPSTSFPIHHHSES